MFLCVYIHVHTLNGNVIDFAVDNFSLQYDIQALLRIWKLCIPIPHTPSKNSSRCLLLAGNDFYIFLSLFDTVSIYLDAQEKSKKTSDRRTSQPEQQFHPPAQCTERYRRQRSIRQLPSVLFPHGCDKEQPRGDCACGPGHSKSRMVPQRSKF